MVENEGSRPIIIRFRPPSHPFQLSDNAIYVPVRMASAAGAAAVTSTDWTSGDVAPTMCV